MSGPSTSQTPARSSSSPSNFNETIRSMIKTPANQELFDRVKDDEENKRFLSAVAEVPLCSYTSDARVLSNFVEDFGGKLLMSDFGSIRKVLSEDNRDLSVDSIMWCVKKVLELQLPQGRNRTTCFNTNACLENDTPADIERLDKSLEAFCNNKDEHIFKRKFVLLPIAVEGGSGFTLLINSKAMSAKKRIYHIRSGIIPDYRSVVIPKVINFLKMFYELPRYKKLANPLKNAEVQFVELGTFESTQTGFQTLYAFREVLKLAENENYNHCDMKHFVDAIKKERDFQNGIDEVQKVLVKGLDNDLNGLLPMNSIGSTLRDRRIALECDAEREAAELKACLASRSGLSEKKPSLKMTDTPKRSVPRKRRHVLMNDNSDIDDVFAPPPNKSSRNAGKRPNYTDCDPSKENESDSDYDPRFK